MISVSVIISFSLAGCGVKTTEEAGTEAQEEQVFLGLAVHAVRNSWEDLYVKAFK